MKLLRKLSPSILFCINFLLVVKVYSQPTSIKNIVVRTDSLISLMTLDEKIGQLNLLSGGQDTGPTAETVNLNNDIEKGNVGGLLNIFGADITLKYQRLA
ncbi:MAG: hypothetical protein ABI813_16730, partial [Bacteroidota bacterium]